ncbi:MAG: type II toxin-antitoxin system prevent-host-death family antitoxin [Deltaproteobacteria bacterium]|nr:type II toxin-antitoxin system prevent-host-death family antitoxin [Deltaproteobacteria bacterium]MBW1819871.1 type II toxin-antitoxin system prevent-host-death family antitoxin [Deltaproteobacteria bacterium]
MQTITVGVREAKAKLSKLLKMVQNGSEVLLTDRNRPVGKIIPLPRNDLSLMERIQRLEDQGMISGMDQEKRKRLLPPPIPISGNIAQKYLQEDRGND